MLRWSLLMAGALLFLQPVTQFAAIVYVLSVFGIGPWTRSFYDLDVEFITWTVIKLVVGIGLLATAAALFRRQALVRALIRPN